MTCRTWTTLAIASLSLLAAPRLAGAQEAAPAFKAGDRVEVDPLLMSNPAHAEWQAGVVRSVDVGGAAYVVEADARAGAPAEVYVIPITSPEKWIRRDGDDRAAAQPLADDEPRARRPPEPDR